MTLKLHRTAFKDTGIFGSLLDDTGQRIAVTCEHAFDSGHGNGSYLPKLPVGSYTCIRGTHKLDHGDPFTTFEVTNVPKHTGILFHAGNYNKDSDGCILLGMSRLNNPDMITSSRFAFAKFMEYTKNVDKFTLIVS